MPGAKHGQFLTETVELRARPPLARREVPKPVDKRLIVVMPAKVGIPKRLMPRDSRVRGNDGKVEMFHLSTAPFGEKVRMRGATLLRLLVGRSPGFTYAMISGTMGRCLQYVETPCFTRLSENAQMQDSRGVASGKRKWYSPRKADNTVKLRLGGFQITREKHLRGQHKCVAGCRRFNVLEDAPASLRSSRVLLLINPF